MARFSTFSPRERQIIPLLVQGKSNKEIALALGISVRTVEFHLSNLYEKLGVASRLEAALKLAEMGFGQSTGADLRESTGAAGEVSADNERRRSAMKPIFYLLIGLLGLGVALLIGFGFSAALHAPAKAVPFESIATEAVTETSTPPAERERTPTAIAAGEYILETIRQKALEYDRAVQAEKQHGQVEFSQDPTTGEERFFFKGESFNRMDSLFIQFLEEKTRLERLYTSLYRAEKQPTPFPTQSSTAQNEAYYEYLATQAAQYCSLESWQKNPNAQAFLLYDPEEGRYRPVYYGEVVARCEVYGQMLEEFRTAPLLVKVNHERAQAVIRGALDKPGLILSFEGIVSLANAPWRSAAVYLDETGAKYIVDIETARLAGIEPNYPTHPEIPAAEAKGVAALRQLARQFALANSPRLAELEQTLLYEENCKGSLCFFRWDARQQDWRGTDWAMMPPFLQVGLLPNGQLATYINTLDLY